MRAAVYHGVKDIRIEEVAEPDGQLQPTEVLVRPRQVGICGTDLHEYVAGPIVTPAEPHPLTGAQIPQILGHEFAADVEAVGSEVSRLVPGDRVSIMPLAWCGHCEFCRRGLNHLCERMACVGLSWAWGGFAGHAVVQDYQAWKLSDELSYEQGALIEPAAVAACGAARGGVAEGDRVLVTGAGPIGALSVLAARAAGAGEVYLSEPNPRRVKRAESLGTTAIFNPADIEVADEVRACTDGSGVDVALECVGNAAALRTCIAATRSGGRIAQVGLHVEDASIDAMELAARELTLIGVWCYPVDDWPRLIAQVASGAFPVERVVSDRIPLSETVSSGFEALIDPAGDQIKILVEPE